MPGGELIEERTCDASDNLGLYTVGGATLYRWTGSQEGTAPATPTGTFATLPATARVRLPVASDPAHWLLVCGNGGHSIGLTAIANDPPQVRCAPGPMTVRDGVQVSQLAPPAALQDLTIASVASDGTTVIAIAGGSAWDFASGKPLHAPGASELARAVATPFGLVLLTRDGALAGIREQRLVRGVPKNDPTLRLAPATGKTPAVWLYGIHTWLAWQPLDGSSGLTFEISGAEASTSTITCLVPAGADMLMARGRRIDRLSLFPEVETHFSVQPVLILPEDGLPILGLAELGGRLVFATAAAIYTLEGRLVAPLVEGLGGPLHPWRGGLLTHDARTQQLYHLTGAALTPITREDQP